MKRIFILGIFLIGLIVNGGEVLDEQLNQGVIVTPVDPKIRAIITQMDEAREKGDLPLFKSLCAEYQRLNPPLISKDEPGVIALEFLEGNYKSGRWTGNDVIIDDAYVYQSFSMDTRKDSLIYLVASRQQNPGDDYTIHIWYSDDGINWYYMYNPGVGNYDFYNPSLKIVETPDTDYLFVAFEAYDKTTSGHDIIVFYSNLVSGDVAYFYPANDSSIDEKNPSLDADDLQCPGIPVLYLAFESEDSIVFMRSPNKGENWIDRAVIGSGSNTWDYKDPSCAFGWYNSADSFTVGVAWAYVTTNGDERIRFRRNRTNGIYQGWLPITYFSAPANCLDSRPSLKMTHEGYPSGVITFERKDTVGTDDADLYEFYTYDGGRNWTDDYLYMPGPSVNKLNCLSVDDSLGDYHVFFKGSGDDIRYKEAHYDSLDFSGWTTSIPISDGGEIANVVSPASAVRDGEPCVCWKINVPIVGNDTLMFDALWLETGVEEEPIEDVSTTPFSLTPNPSNGIAMLSYTVEKEGNVKISLHDITGRTIKNLLDENKGTGRYSLEINNKALPSGIYFVHIKTSDGVYTKSMTVLR